LESLMFIGWYIFYLLIGYWQKHKMV
jgi:hypothetical protein